MFHPFISKAKRRGAYSVYCERGADDGSTWMYDNSFGDPSQEMTASSCVVHFPLVQPRFTIPGGGYGTAVNNYGEGEIGGTLSSELSWVTSPVVGPEKFDKRPVAKFQGGGGYPLTLTQDAPPGLTYNPTGLTSNKFGVGIWYKLNSYSSTGDNRSTLMHVKNKQVSGNTNDFHVRLSLESYYRPTVEVGDGASTVTLQCDCGSANDPHGFETTFYNNNWHYIAVTCDGSRIRMYFDGREVDDESIGTFDFPTTPNIYTYVNRDDDDENTQEGFGTISLCHACVWDRAVPEPEFQRHFHSMFRGSDFKSTNWDTTTFIQSGLQPLRRSDMKYMQRFVMTSTTGESVATEPCRQKPGDEDGEGYTGVHYGPDCNDWYNMFAETAGQVQIDSPSISGAGYYCMSEYTGSNTVGGTTYPIHSHYWNDYGHGPLGTSTLSQCAWENESIMNITLPQHGFTVHREGRTVKVNARYMDSNGDYGYEWELTASNLLDQGATWNETAGDTPNYGKFDAFIVSLEANQVEFWWGDKNITTQADDGPHSAMPNYGVKNESYGAHDYTGFGPNSGSGPGWQCNDRSIHSQVAVFPQNVNEIDYKEVRRIGLGQKTMRTRRPTRDLMRHSLLTAPSRGQIE